VDIFLGSITFFLYLVDGNLNVWRTQFRNFCESKLLSSVMIMTRSLVSRRIFLFIFNLDSWRLECLGKLSLSWEK
jgi:hypothetical protein